MYFILLRMLQFMNFFLSKRLLESNNELFFVNIELVKSDWPVFNSKFKIQSAKGKFNETTFSRVPNNRDESKRLSRINPGNEMNRELKLKSSSLKLYTLHSTLYTLVRFISPALPSLPPHGLPALRRDFQLYSLSCRRRPLPVRLCGLCCRPSRD